LFESAAHSTDLPFNPMMTQLTSNIQVGVLAKKRKTGDASTFDRDGLKFVNFFHLGETHVVFSASHDIM
jgi:hypothetical protein